MDDALFLKVRPGEALLYEKEQIKEVINIIG